MFTSFKTRGTNFQSMIMDQISILVARFLSGTGLMLLTSASGQSLDRNFKNRILWISGSQPVARGPKVARQASKCGPRHSTNKKK